MSYLNASYSVSRRISPQKPSNRTYPKRDKKHWERVVCTEDKSVDSLECCLFKIDLGVVSYFLRSFLDRERHGASKSATPNLAFRLD